MPLVEREVGEVSVGRTLAGGLLPPPLCAARIAARELADEAAAPADEEEGTAGSAGATSAEVGVDAAASPVAPSADVICASSELVAGAGLCALEVPDAAAGCCCCGRCCMASSSSSSLMTCAPTPVFFGFFLVHSLPGRLTMPASPFLRLRLPPADPPGPPNSGPPNSSRPSSLPASYT